MIRKNDIKRMAGSAAYERGLALYNTNHVNLMDVEDGLFGHQAYAMVRGSGRRIYQVSFFVNDADEVEECICECPAYSEYSGICKHCVAALLEYNDHMTEWYDEELPEEEPEAAADAGRSAGGNTTQQSSRSRTDSSKTARSKTARKKPAQHTSPVLMDMLQKKAVVKSLPLLQVDTCGKVRLEPILHMDGYTRQVEFRIGTSRMYVLKDVFSFCDRMDTQEDYQYGKNLHFIHTEASFDEESRPLVRYLQKWGEDNLKSHSLRYSYYGSYMGDPDKVRYLDLKGDELGDLLTLLVGRKIEAAVSGSRNTEWTVVRDPVPRHLTITGDDDGIEIKSTQFRSGGITEKYRIYFHDKKIYLEDAKLVQPITDFLEAMTQLPDGKGYIENKDIPAFCKEVLPEVQKFFKCRMVRFNPEEYGMEPPKFRFYLDAPQMDMITCRPVVSYGRQEYSLYTMEDISVREMDKEQMVRGLIDRYTTVYDPEHKSAAIMDDEERMYDFLTEGVPTLQTLGEVFISDALKRMEVQSAPKVAMGLSLDGGLMELTMTAGDLPRDELIDILSRYNRRKKFYRLKNGAFVNAQDSGLDTLDELKRGLQLTDRQLKQERVEVPKYRALYLDAELKGNPAIHTVKNKSFKSLVRNMKTVEDNDFEVPESLEKVLRAYQRQGFLWIKTLNHNGFGGILADDMGLGKTLQVIAFLLSEQLERSGQSAEEPEKAGNETGAEADGKARKRQNLRNALIVCPASLVYNWNSEITRFAPELTPRMIAGTAEERRRLLEEAGPEDILLTSYDLLKRDIQEYEPYRFRCQIIDEAQYIKNSNTQAAKAVKEIRANFKLALTGTPVENRLSELWSIFDYLMPGFLYSYKKFREEIETPVVQNNDQDVMKRLQKMIRPFVLRRLKKDVLTDLPDKLEENVFAKLEGEQQKLYDAHVQRLRILLDKQTEEEFKSAKITILAELTKLRQLCCDPSLVYEDYQAGSAKAEMCLNLIANAVEGGHKVLLFSQFTTMLDHLAQRLEEAGIRYYMLTGSVSKAKRAEMVEAFNSDDTPVFCISLKAGGTGLNLTAADIVIHFDPWWNLAVQNQATDRAHRIGQKHVVNVYKLIVKDTIEENIIRLQEKKKELADQILEGESLSGGSLTREELLELLKQH